MLQLPLGFFFSALISIIAWRAGALDRSGGLAAFLSGGLIFGLGGLPWAALLLVFFISSSGLSRLFAMRKKSLSEKFSKGSQRDWGQVLANGGLATLLVLLHAWLPGGSWPWVAFAGALAAVNADTWATELGVFSPKPPCLITNWVPVEKGTSGAVSLLGYLAVLAGAALVGITAGVFSPPSSQFPIFAGCILGGLAGSSIDSLLGATVQSIYYCPICRKDTERNPLHTCGSQTVPQRGWRWLNNDWVNFFCSLAGALGSVAVVSLLL